jgi:hypothetical protein
MNVRVGVWNHLQLSKVLGFEGTETLKVVFSISYDPFYTISSIYRFLQWKSLFKCIACSRTEIYATLCITYMLPTADYTCLWD